MRWLALLTALLLALLSGCGGSDDEAAPNRSATLLLDFQPNAVHAGIYTAVGRDYDGALGLDLRVRAPSASTDSVKLLASGRVDLAVLDIHDLALARQAGSDLVGVMALVQRPLAAVLAQPSIRAPRDLEGRRVGVTGLPSDVAVLRSIVQGAGGNPDRVRTTTIGFDAVRSLLTRRVAGATAFWNVEGVAVRERRPGIREFRVDDFGAPAYPELVVSVTRETLRDEPATVRAAVSALARGYQEVLVDPESGVRDLLDAAEGLDREEIQRQLDAVTPVLSSGRRYGELDRRRLEAWARWEKRFGITKRAPNVRRAFDGRFVPRGDRDG